MRTISGLDGIALLASALLSGSMVVLAIILALTGLHVDWSGLGTCILFSLAVTVIGLALKLTGGSPRIANGALVIGCLLGSTLCSTMAVNAGLRLGFPLADARLLAMDRALGFDAARTAAFCSAHPWIAAILDRIYVSSNVMAVAAVLFHGFRRQSSAVPLACYSGGLLIVTIVSTLMPAVGNIAHSGLAFPGLPPGAGTYHLPVFRYYREGLGDVVSNAHLSGVAVFPSFHAIMGLVIASSMNGTRFSGPAVLLGAATIVSALPIGGHYVVDILAGVLVWTLTMRFADAPSTRARRSPTALRAPASAA